jgi:ATP-dependent DNA ligase
MGFANFPTASYLWAMLKSPFEPCIPTKAPKVPDRPEWIHEIKHDGYRLIVQRDGKRERLWTRNGHDWSDRFPLVLKAALRNRNPSFVLDGEVVLLGVDGRSDFNGLHSRAPRLLRRPVRSWVMVKNRQHPAFARVQDQFG